MSALSTVVVVTWRGRDHITACLDALAVQKSPHRTIVVDNASDDGTAALISGHEVVRLPRNRGYAGGLAAVLDSRCELEQRGAQVRHSRRRPAAIPG